MLLSNLILHSALFVLLSTIDGAINVHTVSYPYKFQ